jgi:glycosyltransferase involved in cell wall biosynthesis
MVYVLILHQHFNTPVEGGALRSFYLAKAMIAHGLHPIVITAHGQSIPKTIEFEGIEVHYLPVAYQSHFGFWRRTTSFLKYAIGAFRMTRKFRHVRFCYAISVPLTVGLAAIGILFRYKIHYVFEVGDLWPEAPIQMGFIKNPLLKRFLFSLEKAIYQKASALVALSPMIRQDIMRKVSGKPIHMIPNMADTDFYQPENKDPDLEREFGVAGKFVVSYVGAIGLANGLDFFIDCALECHKANLPVHFLMCGTGAMLSEHSGRAKELDLDNISFVAFQNRAGVKSVMNVTDAAFICYRHIQILETGSPNKYFDGLACGKMIIVNFKGWIKEEIEERRCGVFVDPANANNFVDLISPFIREDSLLKAYQQRSRYLAEEKYSRELLGKKFAEIFTADDYLLTSR